jgi:hypothetical protein
VYKIWRNAETLLQITLRENSRGNLHASQEELSGLIPLKSDGPWDSQAGSLDCMSGGQKQLKGVNQARVHSDQMVPMMAT